MASLAPFSVGCANGLRLNLRNRHNLKRELAEQAVESWTSPTLARDDAQFRQCASGHDKDLIRRHSRLASIGFRFILQHSENG